MHSTNNNNLILFTNRPSEYLKLLKDNKKKKREEKKRRKIYPRHRRQFGSSRERSIGKEVTRFTRELGQTILGHALPRLSGNSF